MSAKKHTVLITIANIVKLVLGLIAGVLITRIYGAVGRGMVRKIEFSMGLLANFITLKIHVGIIYYIASKKIDLKSVIGITLYTVLISLLLLAGILFIAPYVGLNGLLFPAGYSRTFSISVICFLVFFFVQVQVIISSFLRGIRNFEEIFYNQIISSVLKVLIIGGAYLIALKWAFKYTVTQGVYIYIATLAITFFITLYYYLKHFGLRMNLKPNMKTEVLPFYKYSTATFMALLTGYLNLNLDVWIVEYYHGTKELGYYANAVNLCQLLLIFSSTFNDILFPYLSQGNEKERVHYLKTFSKINVFLNLVICGVMAIASVYFIPKLYGHDFARSVLPFQILSVATLFTGVGILFAAYNYTNGKPKYNFYANVAGLIVTIILDFALIPKYGIMGAAIASCVAYFVSTCLIIFTVLKFNRLPLENYFFPVKKDFKSIFSMVRSKFGG